MKRVKIAIVIVFVALAGVIGWLALRPSDEPVYKGRTLTSWLKSYWVPNSSSPGSSTINVEAITALSQMGTNSIPTLLRLVRVRDSVLKVRAMNLIQRQHVIRVQYIPAESWNRWALYGFAALGPNAQSAVPELIQIASQNTSAESRACAVKALGLIGPLAKQATPHLLRCATNAGWNVLTPPIPVGPCSPSTFGPENLQDCAKSALLSIDPEAAAKTGITNAP